MDEIKIRYLAAKVLELTAEELLALNKLISDGGGEALAGVREPRRPPPDVDEAAVGLIPDDYWETAE